MNILYIISSLDPSNGPATAAYQLSIALAKRGHNVTIYTTDYMKGRSIRNDEKIVENTSIKVEYFKCFNYWLARNLYLVFSPDMQLAIKNNIKNFDIIHLHEARGIPNIYLWYYAKNIKKYVVQAHGGLPKSLSWQNTARLFTKLIYDFIIGENIIKSASCLIALTTKEKHEYLKYLVDEKKVKFLSNGINLDEFKNLPEKGIFKRKYSINENDKIILYLGKIHAAKGIDLLINAFAELAIESDEIKLIIAGPDYGMLENLKRLVDNLSLNDSIKFVGPLYAREKLEAYIDADVYVLPSRYDTFPITVLEASGCGTPVIATNNCDIANIIEDSLGLVVKYDIIELKNAIKRLIFDESYNELISNKCKIAIKNEFNWGKIALDLEIIYAQTIAPKEDP